MNKNYCELFIDKIKNSAHINMIYGADLLAGKIYDYLIRHNIKVEGFLVDDDFWLDGMKFRDKNIYSIDEYLKNNKVNIVLGFTKLNEKKMDELNKNINVVEIFAYDFLGAFVLDIDELNIYDELFWSEHIKDFLYVRDLLYDDYSKKEFDLFTNQKRNGTYRKDYCTNIQYFDDEIIKLYDDEIVLDCGAYRGENYYDYISCCKRQDVKPGKVYCFEPDSENISFLREIENSSLEVIPYGVWDENTTLFFSDKQGTNTRVSEKGENQIDVVSIDGLGLEKVTFIKMDVEGSELKALHGAKNIIRNNKPKLAICVYHKKDDLLTIPQYILSLRDDYKFYLRNYASSGVETVLYAI